MGISMGNVQISNLKKNFSVNSLSIYPQTATTLLRLEDDEEDE
jgi:hypothetical protein